MQDLVFEKGVLLHREAMVFRKGVDIHIVIGDGHLNGSMCDCVSQLKINK